jgi:hypothetical protein
MNQMFLMLALMGGGGSVSPQFITAMQDAQKDSFERWSKLLKSLGLIITTGIFYLRGMPAPVDASGAPVFTNEALSKQIQASFQEGKREAFWVALVNSVVDAVLEFMRPSAMQQALDDFAADEGGDDDDDGDQSSGNASADRHDSGPAHDDAGAADRRASAAPRELRLTDGLCACSVGVFQSRDG